MSGPLKYEVSGQIFVLFMLNPESRKHEEQIIFNVIDVYSLEKPGLVVKPADLEEQMQLFLCPSNMSLSNKRLVIEFGDLSLNIELKAELNPESDYKSSDFSVTCGDKEVSKSKFAGDKLLMTLFSAKLDKLVADVEELSDIVCDLAAEDDEEEE